MKDYIFVFSFVCLIMVFGSCKKNTSTQPLQVVTWKIDAGAEQSADTISFIRLFGYNYINASKGTTAIYVATTSTNPGNYAYSSVTAAIGIRIGPTQYSNITGNVTITSNSNNRLNGNFSADLNNGSGGTFSLSGSFSNVSYY